VGSEKRESNTPLKNRLFNEFYRFSFFQAVALLESLFPEKKPLGRTLRPASEVVRFSSQPGLSFPASDISKLEHTEESKPVNMEVTFMGLIGPAGVLPHWYNEQAIERSYRNDHGFKAFYDIFHHRLISLFYLAWKKHRLAFNYLPGAKDRISSYLLCLTGLGTPGLAETIGLPDMALLYFYGGLLSRPISSAAAIESAVGYFSRMPVQVQQFIERKIPISPEDQTQLGSSNSGLGQNMVCGSHIWESQHKFRVNLGPVGYADFLRFLPTGELFRPTFSLIRCMVGIEYEFEIRIFLKREEVPSCILGKETQASWLGLSTWLKTSGITHQDDPCVTFQETNLRLG
jgi:type VI secretion system protein ImpH